MLTAAELKELGDEDLDSLAEGVEVELRRRKNRRVRQTVKTAKAMLAAAGFDVQLIPLATGKTKPEVKAPVAPRPHVEPGLYQNPSNPDETWRPGGRGRQPLWVRRALESGIDISEWRVEEEDEEAVSA